MQALQALVVESEEALARTQLGAVRRWGAQGLYCRTASGAARALEAVAAVHAAVVNRRLADADGADLLELLPGPVLLHTTLEEPRLHGITHTPESALPPDADVYRHIELLVEEAFWRLCLGERDILAAAAAKLASTLALSTRERQVLVLALRGQSSRQMAESLGVGIHTVRAQTGRLREKAGKQRLAEVVAMVLDEL